MDGAATHHTVAVLGHGAPEWAIDGAAADLTARGQPTELDRAIDPVADIDPRRRWPSPPGAAAVVQIEGHRSDLLSQVLHDHGLVVLGVMCTERRELLRPTHRPPGAGARGGHSQVSFVASLPDLHPNTFASRYGAHLEVVRAEHPGVAHYRQDIVVDAVGTTAELAPTAAISQLWFPTRDDFRLRYYASDASAGIVRADIDTFLDLHHTWSILTRESRF